MAYVDFDILRGGGGYSNTTSAWPAVQQLTTYTSTTTKYFGYLKSGATMYNMQSQFYCDLSAGLPDGAILDSYQIFMNLTKSSNTNAGYCHILYDYWGAPAGWTTADQEVATTLDNTPTLAWQYFSTSWVSGVIQFYPYPQLYTHLETRLGTSTLWELTLTSQHLDDYNSTDPGTFANYGSTNTTGNYLRANYHMPYKHSMMLGCNI